MPQYLRSIRQGRWALPQWLTEQCKEVPADALNDLSTTGNKLSVYRADSQNDIDRITIALAATRDNLQNVDYAVFDDAEFQRIGIQITPSLGKTPASLVNDLHHDIVKLTAQQIAALATIIANGRKGRRPHKQIRDGLHLAIKRGELNKNEMKQQLLNALSR